MQELGRKYSKGGYGRGFRAWLQSEYPAPYNSFCNGSVPQALVAFFPSTDFEDAIRNAISIGGDSDTIAAIAGSLAEACYSIPEDLREAAMQPSTRHCRSL